MGLDPLLAMTRFSLTADKSLPLAPAAVGSRDGNHHLRRRTSDR
jgi:hypothetical protein